MSERFRYQSGERLPVEVLVFEVEPEHVDEFIAVDHEVWTLGEAGIAHIPFLSKEVWIDDAEPVHPRRCNVRAFDPPEYHATATKSQSRNC